MKQGQKTVLKGLSNYNGPFQVMTANDFMAHLPGFQPFRFGIDNPGWLPEVIRVKLTQSLGLVTNDLVDETTEAVHELFGENPDWHETQLKQNLLHLVARLSSRVFLGKPLCRNERWLDIAKGYTVDAFISSRVLRALPALIRPAMFWVLPPCRRVRKHYRDAHTLILPEVEMRKERAQKALEAGLKPPKIADTIGWMYELAREQRQQKNYAAAQLTLSMAAIHTTTEGMTQALLDLCIRPEFLQPLREEVIKVVGEEGWTKQAIYKLRLMDSFLKESQRFHPPNFLSMNRLALQPITLSDGTTIPKGAQVMVANRYEDPAIYADPSKFDPYRYLREREKPGQTNTWQHVSLSSQHMAFGLGDHACPGRFFASNEMKIALSHLLLKYDWELPEGEQPFWSFETNTLAKPNCKVRVRRRKGGINLDLQNDES